MSKCDQDLPADIKYSIFDPTGNITALVESDTDISMQPDISRAIMRRHPEVEQVGFVRFDEDGGEVPVQLRMAGGEFCGNATMCAAALYVIRRDEGRTCGRKEPGESACGTIEISVKASGVSEPLRVRLSGRAAFSPERNASDENAYKVKFDTGVLMPPAAGIEKRILECEGIGCKVTGEESIVRLPGIDHIVITQESELYTLSCEKNIAERAIRDLCAALGSDCLGMMFLNTEAGNYRLKPLVYVPGVDTVFWENSCASGTAAAGMYLAAEKGSCIDISTPEPGGVLRVVSDPDTCATWLYGEAKLIM